MQRSCKEALWERRSDTRLPALRRDQGPPPAGLCAGPWGNTLCPCGSSGHQSWQPQSPTQPEIIWKNQTQEKQSKGNTSFNGHINCKDEKCMCKHLVETVKKREPGKMLPEKKYSLEINSRELSTLRYAKCLIDSWFFVCFLPPFSKSSVPQQLVS